MHAPTSAPRVNEGRHTGGVFLLIFIALAAGIVSAGYFVYQAYAQHFRVEVEHQLAAVAELKVAELTEWRKERLGDGSQFCQNSAFAGLVRRFFGKPADADAHGQLQAWLGKFQACGQYDRVRLLDVQGHVRLSVAGDEKPMSAVVAQRLPEILQGGQVVLQDFYRSEYDQRVHLAVLVPVLDDAAGGRPLGVVSLRIDPENFLYPFLQRWPAPSLTAETLLVRREGREVVFLNELRFQTHTALNLRAPLNRVALPAAKAALGVEGSTEGIDYRGVPVVAALRTIPASPWALVARMDAAEVYAPLHERLWLVVAMVAFLLLAAGACMGLLGRQQSARFYRERFLAAETLRASEQSYRALFENMLNGFAYCKMLYDEQQQPVDFVYLAVNKAFEQVTGLKDVVGRPVSEVIPGIRQLSPELFAAYGRVATTGQPESFEFDFKSLKLWLSIAVYRPAQGYFVAVFENITERKQAEAALRQEQILTLTLMDNLPDHIYFKDSASRFLRINPAMARMFGLSSPAQAIGKTDADFFSAEHVQKTLADEQAIMRTGQAILDVEEKETWPDGHESWVVSSKLPLRDPAGKIIGTCGISSIITARKQAETALRESERKLSEAHKLAQLGHWSWEVSTGAVEWSDEVFHIFRLDPGTFIPRIDSILALSPWPEEHARDQDLIRKAMESHEKGAYEQRFLRPDQSIGYYYSTFQGKYNAQGQLISIVGTIQDITKRKRAEATLRESEAQFRAIVDTVPLAIHLTVGLEQVTQYVNPTMVTLFGYTQADIPTIAQWWPLAYPDPLYRQYVAEEWTRRVKHALETQTPIEPMEVVVTCKDGSQKNISWGYITVGDHNYSCGLDLTERKRAEAAQQQSAREVQEKNTELERFLYTASHDLKSPVVTIRTFLGYLEQDMAAARAERVEKDMFFIRGAADKMARLLDELLELSRIGRIVSPPVAITLRALVEEALAAVAGRIAERGVRTKVPDQEVLLYGDRLRLADIWQNLVENAVKFMGDQPVPCIEIGTEVRAAELVFFVRDNGIGIDPRYHEKIFGLFEKLDTKAEGTGIGLAVVKRIVELYGGRIWVESAGPGQGACFYFTLPGAVNKPQEGKPT